MVCSWSGRRERALLLALVLIAVGACRSEPSGSIPVGRADADALPTLYDFARRAGHGTVTGEAPLFDFGPVQTGEFLVDGWSTPERGEDRWFTWAMRETSRLRFYLLDRNRRWLHFSATAAQLPVGMTQSVAIQLNEIEVDRVPLGPGAFTTHTVALPAEALRPGENIVTLEFAHARRLSPTSADPRTLAAAFDYLTISGDPDPPVDPRLADPPSASGADGRLLLTTGTEVAFPVWIPESGRVTFGLAAHRQGEASRLRGEAVLVTPDGVEEAFFVADADADDERWQADLSAWANTLGTLVFRAFGGDAGDTLAWTSPRLTGNAGAMNLTTNVVFIVVDTLRADYLGAYGGDVDTPHIDRLAQSGVRFTRAYAHAPITMPSHSSMFTSLLPTEHGAVNNGSLLASSHWTLAELMRHHYRDTAGFVSLGVLNGRFGIAQGFREYHDDFGHDWWKTADQMNEMMLPWLGQALREPLFLWAHYSDPHEPYGVPTLDYTRITGTHDGATVLELASDSAIATTEMEFPPGGTAVALAGSAGGRRVRLSALRVASPALTVTCQTGCTPDQSTPQDDDYHTTLPATLRVENPTTEAVTSTLRVRATDVLSPSEARERYRQEVEYLDERLGALLDALEARSPDTLIVLTADHGESLGQHGLGLGHVNSLYEPVVRVPLVLHWPGRLPEGAVVTETVSHIDILPTLLELLGLQDVAPRSGRSLVPLLRDAASGREGPPIVTGTFPPEAQRARDALIADRYKLILTPETGTTELYDLEQDPGERENIAERDSTRAASLAQMLEDRLARARARAATPETQVLTEEQLEGLRSLGYVR